MSDTTRQPAVVAIVGPTAVGKSALALELAPLYRGEIVSADSRQVYRHMDIGTAKPTPAELASVAHHLVNVVDLDQPFTLADYQAAAYTAISDIHRRGGLPLVVGGTGLYVRAALGGFSIPRVPPNETLRAELEEYARHAGAAALHERLRAVDAAAAARIDYRNVRRVIRALEVQAETGRPMSEQQVAEAPPWRVLTIGLTLPRAELYRRIDERVDWQLRHGLIEETARLIASGYRCDLPAMSSLGYRQICQYLRGEVDLELAIDLIKTRTHRFARQQYTWFRPDDPDIHWLAAGPAAVEVARRLVDSYLSG